MDGCWTTKKAERWRIDAFKLWCWRRLLRVPWTARRSNHSILKKISPGCSLEGMLLKLKLQYFGHLMRRVDSLEKSLMLGGIGGRRRRGWQRMRWLDGITNSMDVSLSEFRELEEKGTTEDEMAGWHHRLDGREFEWTLGVDGQGGLACCDSWVCKESDTTEWLNWTELNVYCKKKKKAKWLSWFRKPGRMPLALTHFFKPPWGLMGNACIRAFFMLLLTWRYIIMN